MNLHYKKYNFRLFGDLLKGKTGLFTMNYLLSSEMFAGTFDFFIDV